MLLEMAIGDAYGAGFEYVRDRRFVRTHNTLEGYIQHPRHRLKPGRYTDDTQMSLAIAEHIIAGKPWTGEAIADSFVETFRRDRPFREGYSGGFFGLLKKVKTGRELLALLRPTSDKSGAAMRAAPIGVFPTAEAVVEKCTVQARITHDTRDGINAACVVALMSHYMLYRLGPLRDMPAFLRRHVEGAWDEPWRGEVGSRGWMSVRAALTALTQRTSLSKVLMTCISFTGDVDTVAAIALAVGSHATELHQDLPRVLMNQLENGPYGREHLAGVNWQLMQRMAGIRAASIR